MPIVTDPVSSSVIFVYLLCLLELLLSVACVQVSLISSANVDYRKRINCLLINNNIDYKSVWEVTNEFNVYIAAVKKIVERVCR